MSSATNDHHAHDDHGGHHVLPIPVYLKVYGGLLVLTVLTVLVSFASLGPFSFPAAMIVALMKASLVAGFFMHLRYDDRFNSFVFLSSVIFLMIFFVFTFLDLSNRDRISSEEGNYKFQRDRAYQNRPATP